LTTQATVHCSEGGGGFVLSDTIGRSVVVASPHNLLGAERLSWLRQFLAEELERAASVEQTSEEGAPEGRGVLVDFFQAVHAGLFRERQRLPGEEIGEVSVIAAYASGDTIEIGSAGRCAAYRLAGSDAKKVLPTDDDAMLTGLGSSLKVSMDVVRRAFSEDSVYVLMMHRIDTHGEWGERLVQAVKASRARAVDASEILYGEDGGALAIIEGSVAQEALSEAIGASWYKKLREELARAFRRGRRETVPAALDETPQADWGEPEGAGAGEGEVPALDLGEPEAGEIVEEEVPVTEWPEREASELAEPGESIEATEEVESPEQIETKEEEAQVAEWPETEAPSEAGSEESQEEEVPTPSYVELESVAKSERYDGEPPGTPERERELEPLAEAPVSAEPEFKQEPMSPAYLQTAAELLQEGGPVFIPTPQTFTGRKRQALTIPVKTLGYVFAAAAVVLVAYAFWSSHSRILGAFSFLKGGERSTSTSGEALKSAIYLTSVPSGAEVILDDRVTGERTPAGNLTVLPGTHELKLKLGELGEWTGNVSLEAGDTAKVNVAFVGDIVVSSPPKEGLSVFVDGELKGSTPCHVESVPAGFHVVKVEGEGYASWQEEVIVTYGGISEVTVKPGKLPDTGQIRVTSRLLGEDGYEETGGVPVSIDGKRAGVTPFKADLKPGLHSVRVGGGESRTPMVYIVEVRPGGKHVIRGELGGSEPIIIECSETRAPARNETIIYASMTGTQEANLSDVSVYLEKSDGRQVRWQPMVLLPGSARVYASVVPEVILSAEGALKYYVRARTADGIEFYSDVRTVSQR
jgi:hypothetical protein